jgi:hypothetical protein
MTAPDGGNSDDHPNQIQLQQYRRQRGAQPRTQPRRGDAIAKQATREATQLYDVCTKDGAFLMTAPMMVISEVFKMHRDAAHRVVTELASSPVSVVHFNNRRPMWQIDQIVIGVSRHRR